MSNLRTGSAVPLGDLFGSIFTPQSAFRTPQFVEESSNLKARTPDPQSGCFNPMLHALCSLLLSLPQGPLGCSFSEAMAGGYLLNPCTLLLTVFMLPQGNKQIEIVPNI
jgi:hypothetical protein